MDNIVIFGASGHAKVVVDIITLQAKYKIAGAVSPTAGTLPGIDYIGTDDDILGLVKKYSLVGGIIAIGDVAIRRKIAEKISSICPEFLFIKAIHPSSIIAKDVIIGEGAMVMAGAVINSCAVIGKHCIVNSNSTVEHDNLIKDYVNISPSVTTGGNVTIKTGTVIGIGSNILPNITIGENAVIGAASLVCKDIPDNVVCYGIPARVKRKKD